MPSIKVKKQAKRTLKFINHVFGTLKPPYKILCMFFFSHASPLRTIICCYCSNCYCCCCCHCYCYCCYCYTVDAEMIATLAMQKVPFRQQIEEQLPPNHGFSCSSLTAKKKKDRLCLILITLHNCSNHTRCMISLHLTRVRLHCISHLQHITHC